MNHILKRAFGLSDILANRPETNLDATTSHSGMRTERQATASLSSKQTLQTNPKQNLKILEAIFLGILPKEICYYKYKLAASTRFELANSSQRQCDMLTTTPRGRINNFITIRGVKLQQSSSHSRLLFFGLLPVLGRGRSDLFHFIVLWKDHPFLRLF